MELRAYSRILRRRWWLPVLLTLLVAGLSGVQLRPWQTQPASQYSTQMRLLLGVMPASNADEAAYDPRYYAWLTSEYLVDDFTEVIRSQLFAERISARLAERAITIPAGAIGASAATGKQHRIISLGFTWPDEDEARAIAVAAATELKENAVSYFRQLGTEGASIEVLDGPTVSPIGASTRQRFEFPLRVALALIVGLALAFLLDYLDDSIRSRADIEALNIPIIGTIPKHG